MVGVPVVLDVNVLVRAVLGEVDVRDMACAPAQDHELGGGL